MSTRVSEKVVLLADDDPDDAEMFALVLSEVAPSIKFYHVENGLAVFEFLQRMGKQLPDVIFMDINMPQMSGWECLTALKSNATTKEIPVLIYSTSSHAKDKQIATQLGATGFITKPSDYRTLRRILGTIATNLEQDVRQLIHNL
jgi:CheY-like chemotaxis protein